MPHPVCDFSVVTPSFNMLPYLKRCASSVADQTGASHEHLVVDGRSTDGTADWLRGRAGLRGMSEPDSGMYDAVNKGFALTRGRFVSYLNCDEQYLPGTLTYVKDFFSRNPQVDLVFGDSLLIRPDGTLIAYRKGYQPRWYFILASHLYVLSCTLFMRRRVIEDGFRFDRSLRDIGDEDLVVRLLRRGYRASHARRYLAAFTMTGHNMSAKPNALAEKMKARKASPAWVRWMGLPLNAARLTEKWLSGAYSERLPLSYSVYTSGEAPYRSLLTARSATYRWRAC
jgi:glycosyltransferase involved in cell wall biosynthesis